MAKKAAKQKAAQPKVKLVVPTQPSARASSPAEAGGQQQSMREVAARIVGTFGVREQPAERMKADLDSVVETAKSILQSVKGKLGDFKVEGLELGLAVTASGSIGIATAGVEASLTLQLKYEGRG